MFHALQLSMSKYLLHLGNFFSFFRRLYFSHLMIILPRYYWPENFTIRLGVKEMVRNALSTNLLDIIAYPDLRK